MDIVSKGKMMPGLGDFLRILLTFGLTMLAWIFFRAENISQAINMISEIFSSSLFLNPDYISGNALILLIIITVFVVIEWFGREGQHAIADTVKKWSIFFRWGFYFVIITLLFVFSGDEQEFIYFQF